MYSRAIEADGGKDMVEAWTGACDMHYACAIHGSLTNRYEAQREHLTQALHFAKGATDIEPFNPTLYQRVARVSCHHFFVSCILNIFIPPRIQSTVLLLSRPHGEYSPVVRRGGGILHQGRGEKG